MDENYNRDPFEPDVTDTTYRSQNIQDESNIFEEKVTPSYEAPRYDAYRFNEEKTDSSETSQDDAVESKQNVWEQAETTPVQEAEEAQETQETQTQTEAWQSSRPVYGTYSETQAEVNDETKDEAQNETRHEGQERTANRTAAGHTASGGYPSPGRTVKRKKKAKGGFGKKLGVCVVLAAVFGLVSGGIFLGVAKIGSDKLGLNKPETPVVGMVGEDSNVANAEKGEPDKTVAASANTSGDYTVAEVAERCMPAMVGITNKSIQEIPSYFGFGSQNYESESSGSGIIVSQNDNELLIATNNHVVSGATTLTVCFVDDALVDATIKGTDAQNDLAVISVKISDIPEETLSQIKVIQLGDSDSLKVGDQVVAIGNALGYGQSVSAGIVSALDREIAIENQTYSMIQTDAAINPGNSGGALLNMNGELIGINESKYADTDVEGMGYAIPISTATPILSNLMSRETRYKVDEENASYIGISCKDISSEFAEMYNVPTGVYIDSVVEGGPAAMAGLQKGDIITGFGDTTITSYADLIGQLEYYAAGEIVDITFYRTDSGFYSEKTTSLTLGAKKDSELAESQTEQSQDSQSQEEQNDQSGNYGYEGQSGFNLFDLFGY